MSAFVPTIRSAARSLRTRAVFGLTVLVASFALIGGPAIAAPASPSSVTVGSAGSFRVGTTSRPVSFSFVENAAACFTAAATPDAIVVTILDSSANDQVHFVGRPNLSGASGSLAATVTVPVGADNEVHVSFGRSNVTQVEQFTISGLSILASAPAAPGAILANVTGVEASCVLSQTAVASGELAQVVQSNGGGAVIALQVGLCHFTATGGSAGPLQFIGFNAESQSVSSTADAGGGVEVVSATFANPHAPGQTVTQTVANCTNAIGSPGTMTP